MCGKIISLWNSVGSLIRLMVRNTFAVVKSVTNWNSLVSLTPEYINELNFWKDNLATISGVPLWPVKRKPTKIGQILRALIVPHFVSFFPFHCLYKLLNRLPRGADCCLVHR